MKFDVQGLVRELALEYRPPNFDWDAGIGNVWVKCPWCGSADPSQHMGINVANGKWGCWRDRDHRGNNPYRLVRELTGWPHERIVDFIGEGLLFADSPQSLRQRLAALDEPEVGPAPLVSLKFLPEFRRIKKGDVLGHQAARYLRLRKFGKNAKEVAKFARHYKIRYARSGRFKWRVILPIIDRGKMIGWTARAMANSSLRYMAHPPGNDVKRVVFNGWRARGGLVLVIVEGPMDALKLDYYGRRLGVSAVALMGVVATPEQLERIHVLARRYRAVVVLLDDSALSSALKLKAELSVLKPRVAKLPDGRKDPGEMPPSEARRFAKMLVEELSASPY